ncbi:MAG: VTT domain-containing protein, partial [Cyanobacteria bacterium J06558_2]
MFKLIPRKYHRLVIRLVKQLINPQVLALIAAIAAVLLLCLFSPLKAVFNPILFKNFIEQHEGYIEVVFIALYTILTIVGIPGTVLTVVGGSLFGIWYGTLISTIAATAGALGAFCAARYLFHQSAQRKFRRSKKLSRFQSAVLKQPFLFVLT